RLLETFGIQQQKPESGIDVQRILRAEMVGDLVGVHPSRLRELAHRDICGLAIPEERHRSVANPPACVDPADGLAALIHTGHNPIVCDTTGLYAIQARRMRMRIAMTGYGAVTPLGVGVDALWSGLVEGRSAVRELERLDVAWADLPVRVAAPVTADLEAALGGVSARRLDRSQQMALIATDEAWRDSGLRDCDPERLAVSVGTGVGGVQTLLDQDDVLESRGPRRVSPRTVPMLMPNGASAQISIEYAAKAGVFTPASACASGAEA